MKVANVKKENDKMIWANLLHLGYNMWSDREDPEFKLVNIVAKPYLRFDDALWNDLLREMVQVGMNMVVIDVGEGIKYDSHPELSVKGSWNHKRLQQELTKLRQMGLEPIPKLNFSTAHDTWLGPYARCVSSDIYYAVCRDLIAEVIDLFDKPRFFHLGMDEETFGHQMGYAYSVVRQHDLWWHDFLFLVKQVEKKNVRAWIWSDYVWQHPELFFKRMPKSVVQSNWYYGKSFSQKLNYVKAYDDLEAHGYDQIPTGSNWCLPENFPKTVKYCKKNISSKRLMGFLQAPWHPTLETFRGHHLEAVKMVAEGMK